MKNSLCLFALFCLCMTQAGAQPRQRGINYGGTETTASFTDYSHYRTKSRACFIIGAAVGGAATLSLVYAVLNGGEERDPVLQERLRSNVNAGLITGAGLTAVTIPFLAMGTIYRNKYRYGRGIVLQINTLPACDYRGVSATAVTAGISWRF
jgi:hypothetical protein